MPVPRRTGRLVSFGCALLVTSCFGGLAAAEPFSITSSSFKDGTVLDKKYVGSVIVNEANSRYFESGPERSYMAGLQWGWR